MNIAELQYYILTALRDNLKEVNVKKEYDVIIYTVPVSHKQYAEVKCRIMNYSLCRTCGEIIDNPDYGQTTHDTELCRNEQ